MYSPQPLDFLSNQSGRDNGFKKLSLRKLEALACALLSVLLPFLDAWIACHQAGVFEGRTQVAIILEQRARNAVPDRSGLARGSAAGDIDHEVKLVRRF